MGNLFEELGNQEIQLEIEEINSEFVKQDSDFLSNKEIIERKTDFILKEMENSYQRLERVLKVFNRMR